MEDKLMAICIFEDQIHAVSRVNSVAARMCAAEMQILLERFRRDELTVDECAELMTRVMVDYMGMVLQ